MSIWKVLGGAAVCVTAVVALPVAGPVGAITAVGAGVAVAVGAVGGAMASVYESDEQEESRRKGQQEGRAFAQMEFSERERQLENQVEKLLYVKNDMEAVYSKILAIYTFGVAISWAKGYILDDEREAMNDFNIGGDLYFPPHIKQRFHNCLNNGVEIGDALECLFDNDMFSKETLPILNEIIDYLILVDNGEEKHAIKTILNQNLLG